MRGDVGSGQKHGIPCRSWTVRSCRACGSKRIGFYFRSARPISSGTVEAGGRKIPLQVGRNRQAYRAPIWDKSIPNNAIVRLNPDSRR